MTIAICAALVVDPVHYRVDPAKFYQMTPDGSLEPMWTTSWTGQESVIKMRIAVSQDPCLTS